MDAHLDSLSSAFGAEIIDHLDQMKAVKSQHDPVKHPKHYTSHPSGVECIDVIEHMLCNMANAIKYIWRADLKCDAIEDLEKAVWYLNREINRRKKAQS